MVSDAVAAALRVGTGSKNSTVAVFVDHDAQVIASIMGVLKAGCIYVPLDPSLTGTRNSVIIDDSLATTVVTDNRNYGRAQALFGSACTIFNVDELIAA